MVADVHPPIGAIQNVIHQPTEGNTQLPTQIRYSPKREKVPDTFSPCSPVTQLVRIAMGPSDKCHNPIRLSRPQGRVDRYTQGR
jgi:hypothetical protein